MNITAFPFSGWRFVSLVPVMTSNTAPYGIASATMSNATAFQAFNGTGWSASGNGTYAIQFQFPTQRVVLAWSLSLSGSSSQSPNALQGSNDGVNWVNVSTQNPFTGSKIKTVSAPGSYFYYRYLWSSFAGASISGVIFQMYGY